MNSSHPSSLERESMSHGSVVNVSMAELNELHLHVVYALGNTRRTRRVIVGAYTYEALSERANIRKNFQKL